MPGTIYLQRPTPTWQAVGPTMATDLFRTLLARNMRSQLLEEEASYRLPRGEFKKVWDADTKSYKHQWIPVGTTAPAGPEEKKMVAVKTGDYITYGHWAQGQFIPALGKDGKPMTAPRYKPTTTVNVTANVAGPTKATQNIIQKDMLETEDMVANIDAMLNMVEPDFFTYWGKGRVKGGEFVEKATGVPYDAKFRNKAKVAEKFVKQQMLKERKWFTGVAGGEKEMAQIEKTSYDWRDSYSTFVSNARARRLLAKAHLARLKKYNELGFNIKAMTPEKRAQLADKDPIEGYMEFETPDEVRDAFDFGLINQDFATNILRQKFGYE